MTKNNIKKIALEVGFDDGEIDKCQLMLERFAYLVAQHERNEIIEILDASTGYVHMDLIRNRGQA